MSDTTFIFGREAADTIVQLEKLQSKKCTSNVSVIIEVQIKRDFLKTEIVDLLFNEIRKTNDSKLRNKLINP